MDKKILSCKYCHKQIEANHNANDIYICPSCKRARIGWYILFSFIFCSLYSIFTVLLSYAGISLGAIPTMLLFGAVLYFIRISSEAMTERRYYREAKKAEKEKVNISFTKTVQNNKTILSKFCKKCGGKIDDETRKCTKCGKQYFKPINLTPNFCKVCGSPVDKVTGKCTKCNKQYFKFSTLIRNKKFIITASIILGLLLGVFLYHLQPVYIYHR